MREDDRVNEPNYKLASELSQAELRPRGDMKKVKKSCMSSTRLYMGQQQDAFDASRLGVMRTASQKDQHSYSPRGVQRPKRSEQINSKNLLFF